MYSFFITITDSTDDRRTDDAAVCDRRRRHRSIASIAIGPVMEAPRTVDEVFANFSARRTGLVRALTGGTYSHGSIFDG